MKDKIIEFFKDKYNLIIFILETVAIVSLLIAGYVVFFACAFFVLQGATCIVWALKLHKKNKDILQSKLINNELPYTIEQIKIINDRSDKEYKSNKLYIIILFIVGIVLALMSFGYIF